MTYPVQQIQRSLNGLGFGPLVVDGVKGPRTDAAIVAFKQSIGFRARPYVGPLTWAALSAPAAESDIPWLSEALLVKGLHEARNRARLVDWFDRSVSWIDPREIPWCGAFVATCLRRWDGDIALPENPLGARNWKKFGEKCPPQLGSVLVFWRGSKQGWKGHAGFYWGEDGAAYHVLGGNQSNAVNVTRVSKDRLIDARWPEAAAQSGKRIFLNRNGTPLSTNEV